MFVTSAPDSEQAITLTHALPIYFIGLVLEIQCRAKQCRASQRNIHETYYHVLGPLELHGIDIGKLVIEYMFGIMEYSESLLVQ